MSFQAQLDFLLEQARAAAQIMVNHYQGNFKVYTKPDNSQVTDIDLAVSEMWQKASAEHFPEVGLYSEESPHKSYEPGKDYFVVDELDGTSYYVEGRPGFTHQAAYYHSEEGLVIGVLAYPLDDLLLYAVKGQGVFVQQGAQPAERVAPAPVKPLDKLLYGHPERYQGDKYYQLFARMGIPEARILQVTAYRTLMMARGELDVNIFLMRKIEPWDWAGEKVIVEELGLTHRYLDGAPVQFGQAPRPDNPGYIVCPAAHLQTLARLATT